MNLSRSVKEILKKRGRSRSWNERQEAELKSLLCNMGNIVHESVVASEDETFNWLSVRTSRTASLQILTPEEKAAGESFPSSSPLRLDGFDAERGKSQWSPGYFLKNIGLRLNQAFNQLRSLISWGNVNTIYFKLPSWCVKKWWPNCVPTGWFRWTTLQGSKIKQPTVKTILVTSLPVNKRSLYPRRRMVRWPRNFPNVTPVIPLVSVKPVPVAGTSVSSVSTNSEKVEQFCITEPEIPGNVRNHDWPFGSLFINPRLSYRIVEIVGGALNNAAARGTTGWSLVPHYGEYKELVSCSNCTDYQSRRLEIRCGLKKLGEREKKYVHCLNSTLFGYWTYTLLLTWRIIRLRGLDYSGEVETLPWWNWLCSLRP